MNILAIETSCDETGVALVSGTKTENGFAFAELGAFALNSQAKLHAEFGGVYPNLAKREHEKNLPIILEQALKNVGDEPIDAIAVTQGPGLEPALWAGITFAENLAKEKNLPLIAANHMEGHLISSLVQDGLLENVQLPVLGLLISGGHTEYVLMREWFNYEVIGETQDDAVGEAFDKVARMLGLPYPGGPQISKLAEQARVENMTSDLELPRPMLHNKDLNVSFSGLKTAVLYKLRDMGGVQNLSHEQKMVFALEFETAVGDIFVAKTRRALEETDAKTFVIGGGVAANTYLRERLVMFLEDEFPNVEVRLPNLAITGDNAVMIAEAALARALSGIDDVAKEPLRAYSNRFSILAPK
ncbi:MAG TPA: tRNA (adenosine(37)-N6)-threonylcarbamoyltransferase complex transferase subunit TsaD [Candidatus Paceibacterota bacterium]|nr:tRNA (adenosine(37)-N6)-threonylcarbamoyltransferase complex transferase subunit TsaD [Candidatus Paceibacterota bacterium]